MRLVAITEELARSQRVPAAQLNIFEMKHSSEFALLQGDPHFAELLNEPQNRAPQLEVVGENPDEPCPVARAVRAGRFGRRAMKIPAFPAAGYARSVPGESRNPS